MTALDLTFFANPEQWRGCVTCHDHHHETSFCQKCGRCYFSQLNKISRPGAGTSMDFDVIKCACGAVNIWD